MVSRCPAGTLLGLALVSLLGCAQPLHTIDRARRSFYAGDLGEAQKSLAPICQQGGRFADVASLDLAIVELTAGDVASAERRLRGLRDQFDQTPAVASLQRATSIVTDDTARAFRPAGYEQVMIRTLLAICSLAGDGIDAESYALQATMKQTELARLAEQRGISNVSDAYQPIAIAPYLRGVLREATHRDYDDAAKAYRLVSDVRPDFAPAAADIARVDQGIHSSPGDGVLYVIACVGRGPQLVESTAETTSAALSIASSVIRARANQHAESKSDLVLPNIASVKVPRVVVPPAQVAAIGVRINGKLYGATQTLTDVGQLATNQIAAEMPWTISRAVLRRAAKEAAVAKSSDLLGLSGSAGSLFHFAAVSSWSGSERADTRCWGLLPREIQVFRCELPRGQLQIELQAIDPTGNSIGWQETETVSIVDGRNSYLFVICPTSRLHLVNSPPRS